MNFFVSIKSLYQKELFYTNKSVSRCSGFIKVIIFCCFIGLRLSACQKFQSESQKKLDQIWRGLLPDIWSRKGVKKIAQFLKKNPAYFEKMPHKYRLIGLHSSVVANHADSIKTFISMGLSPNSCDENDVPILIHAVRLGTEVGVKTLLQLGADPNKKGPSRQSPLFLAGFYRDMEIMKDLLHAGAYDVSLFYSLSKDSTAIFLLCNQIKSDPIVAASWGSDFVKTHKRIDFSVSFKPSFFNMSPLRAALENQHKEIAVNIFQKQVEILEHKPSDKIAALTLITILKHPIATEIGHELSRDLLFNRATGSYRSTIISQLNKGFDKTYKRLL